MPVTRPTTPRRATLVVTAMLIPALVLPGAAAHGGPVVTQGATAAAPGSVGSLSSAPLAGGSLPTVAAPRAAVRQPTVAELGLSGVNRAVRDAAPDPHHHDHGTVGALSTAGDDLKLAVAAKVRIRKPAALVAVTADEDFPAGTSIQVRVKEKKYGWSPWTALEVDPEHGPDPRSDEATAARPGSDPLMAVRATKAQVRIDTPTGSVPAGTRLATVNAPTGAADRTVSTASMRSSTLSAASTVSRPPIVTRSQWGADESWRSRAPYYTDNIRVGFIHHTASTSNYSAAQAAAQIRSIYAYHTKSLGHSDIDYNFVVDRFGRLYEGRYGGIDRPVLGGHTAGFNEHSFAAVVLGNFETFAPARKNMAAIKDTLARLWAWKLGLSGVSPDATVKVVSDGFIRPTRYPKGSVATLRATSTHQTVNFTSCPGKYLQAEVPSIIELGARYSDVVISAPSPPTFEFKSGTRSAFSVYSSVTGAVSWTADVLSPCSDTPIRTYTGTKSGPGRIRIKWDLRDSAGNPVLPATYTIRLSGTEADGTSTPVVTSTLTMTPQPGGTWGPCANASRVAGSSASTTSVLWGRIAAPDSRVVVLTGEATANRVALAAGVAAAPLARSLRAPLLVTPPKSLSQDVADDLRARGATQVLLVGGSRAISGDVQEAVAALGVPVERIQGRTKAKTAAVVAARMASSDSAVIVSTTQSPAHALAGAALAAARGVPVLLAGTGPLPAATVAAASGMTSVTVAATTSAVGDADLSASLGGISWQRLVGSDAVTASTTVAAAFPRPPRSAMILPDTFGAWATATAAAATASPLLFTPSPVLAPDVASYLRARSSMRAITTTVGGSVLDDDVLGAASRLLLGLPWAPPGVTTPSISPAPSPTGVYRLARANAKPEPALRGATLRIRSRAEARFTDGTWQAVPAGTAFLVQFKRAGRKKWREVASGYTVAGKARTTVTAKRSGAWRIKIGSVKSRRDYVRVTTR